MARNEEKAQSMLHRYLRTRAGEDGQINYGRNHRQRRPYLAALCEDVDEAQRWHRQVLGEISRKVSEIQNAGLGEARIQELNDEINKLIRESRHWERRIRELGGRQLLQDDKAGAITQSAVSHKGYFYFGAARELPSVAALLEGKKKRRTEEDDKSTEVTLDELSRRVDPRRYFGFEDSQLEEAELKRENDDVQAAIRLWESSGCSSENATWDPIWEQFVGKCPPSGKQLEEALTQIALEKRKAELREEVEHMQ